MISRKNELNRAVVKLAGQKKNRENSSFTFELEKKYIAKLIAKRHKRRVGLKRKLGTRKSISSCLSSMNVN